MVLPKKSVDCRPLISVLIHTYILVVFCAILIASINSIFKTRISFCDIYIHRQHSKGQYFDYNRCLNKLYMSDLYDSELVDAKHHVSFNQAGKREFRAIWIATVANIDWPSSTSITITQQQSELLNILNMVEQLNMNAVIFQVRPAGDALYASLFEPWSIYVTGEHGVPPSPFWDPLAFIVAEAHKRNFEVHAWINPYRARLSSKTYELAPNHMAKRFPTYAYSYANQIWMDPGSSEVQDFIGQVVEDIVSRYAVDGIHMDDYFYPYSDGTEFPDHATYASFQEQGGALILSDWRRSNVNSLVNSLNRRIHAIQPKVKFGISPFGIWKSGFPTGIAGLSSFDSLFCDSRLWLQEGLVDYLTPQLYWKIDPPAQSYSALLSWWIEQSTKGRHIYPGNAVYRLSETVDWPVTEIVRQINMTRSMNDRLALGNVFFSTKQIMQNIKGIRDQLAILYEEKVTVPMMNWL